jgi:hypothetical protein
MWPNFYHKARLLTTFFEDGQEGCAAGGKQIQQKRNIDERKQSSL